ncbi:hypothetical protein B6U91_02155 [Candidatus Pacearchaeota archaeon ex4484_71]|nr:MAG: hypothetical protein B6U91_02155 [Candidatus Pacearchaeota archaeon ex4484_71]
MENKKVLPRTGLMGGSECEYFREYGTYDEPSGKVYCKIETCPYNNLIKKEFGSIDLSFNECSSRGLVKKFDVNKLNQNTERLIELTKKVREARKTNDTPN